MSAFLRVSDFFVSHISWMVTLVLIQIWKEKTKFCIDFIIWPIRQYRLVEKCGISDVNIQMISMAIQCHLKVYISVFLVKNIYLEELCMFHHMLYFLKVHCFSLVAHDNHNSHHDKYSYFQEYKQKQWIWWIKIKSRIILILYTFLPCPGVAMKKMKIWHVCPILG